MDVLSMHQIQIKELLWDTLLGVEVHRIQGEFNQTTPSGQSSKILIKEYHPLRQAIFS
ncbi:MAG: hypothetical protein Kow0042_27300 [Calditrichia bacterium]